jgi:hypothetical protein
MKYTDQRYSGLLVGLEGTMARRMTEFAAFHETMSVNGCALSALIDGC